MLMNLYKTYLCKKKCEEIFKKKNEKIKELLLSPGSLKESDSDNDGRPHLIDIFGYERILNTVTSMEVSCLTEEEKKKFKEEFKEKFFSKVDVKCIILGKTGSGKSNLINSLCGEYRVESSDDVGSVTKSCQCVDFELSKPLENNEKKVRRFRVLDTIGFGDTADAAVDSSDHDNYVIANSTLGSKINQVIDDLNWLILVVRVGRFDRLDRKYFELVHKFYGNKPDNVCIVVTGCKDLLTGHRKIVKLKQYYNFFKSFFNYKEEEFNEKEHWRMVKSVLFVDLVPIFDRVLNENRSMVYSESDEKESEKEKLKKREEDETHERSKEIIVNVLMDSPKPVELVNEKHRKELKGILGVYERSQKNNLEKLLENFEKEVLTFVEILVTLMNKILENKINWWTEKDQKKLDGFIKDECYSNASIHDILRHFGKKDEKFFRDYCVMFGAFRKLFIEITSCILSLRDKVSVYSSGALRMLSTDLMKYLKPIFRQEKEDDSKSSLWQIEELIKKSEELLTSFNMLIYTLKN